MSPQETATTAAGVPPNLGRLHSASVYISSSTAPIKPLQGRVASAYVAGGISGPTMEDLMDKLLEMLTNMQRMQVELDQVKASTNQELQPLPGEEAQIHPPPPPFPLFISYRIVNPFISLYFRLDCYPEG